MQAANEKIQDTVDAAVTDPDHPREYPQIEDAYEAILSTMRDEGTDPFNMMEMTTTPSPPALNEGPLRSWCVLPRVLHKHFHNLLAKQLVCGRVICFSISQRAGRCLKCCAWVSEEVEAFARGRCSLFMADH